MTDLHCHILHGIDDGPADLAGSLELCRIAWNNNIERIVATPHVAESENPDAFLEKRGARLSELRAALAQYGMPVEVFAGAEVSLAGGPPGACPNRLTLNGSRYLLAELPASELSLTAACQRMVELRKCRLVPIVAHPERYTFFQRDHKRLNALLEAGALLQVNAGSLCRPERGAVRRLAREIVLSGAASFLATDAHSASTRPNRLLSYLSAIEEEVDFDYLDALVNVNPESVLKDRTLPNGVPRRIGGKQSK